MKQENRVSVGGGNRSTEDSITAVWDEGMAAEMVTTRNWGMAEGMEYILVCSLDPYHHESCSVLYHGHV